MVDDGSVHVSEIVKPAWKAPNGVIVPDYAYPIVKQLQIMQEAEPTKPFSAFSYEEVVTTDVKKEVLGLLQERLTYLNDGIETLDLSVLPLEEYKIFQQNNIHIMPKFTGKTGTGREQQTLNEEKSLVQTLQNQVSETSHVQVEKILNEPGNKGLKRAYNFASGHVAFAFGILSFISTPFVAVSAGAGMLPLFFTSLGTLVVGAAVPAAALIADKRIEKKISVIKNSEEAELSKNFAISYLVSAPLALTEKGQIRDA